VTTGVATTRFGSPDDLLTSVGRSLGTTPWLTVDPGAVRDFCRATETPVESPGQVPPLMLVSLTNYFLPQLLEVGGISSGVNYGSGEIRFNAPVSAGDRIRATATITEATDVPRGVQTVIQILVEADHASEPVCTVESLSRWLR
jgi:hypothetical protein